MARRTVPLGALLWWIAVWFVTDLVNIFLLHWFPHTTGEIASAKLIYGLCLVTGCYLANREKSPPPVPMSHGGEENA